MRRLRIYIFAVFIGPYMTVSAVWTIADIFNGLMALPNMIRLSALSGLLSGNKSVFKKQSGNKVLSGCKRGCEKRIVPKKKKDQEFIMNSRSFFLL